MNHSLVNIALPPPRRVGFAARGFWEVAPWLAGAVFAGNPLAGALVVGIVVDPAPNGCGAGLG